LEADDGLRVPEWVERMLAAEQPAPPSPKSDRARQIMKENPTLTRREWARLVPCSEALIDKLCAQQRAQQRAGAAANVKGAFQPRQT
jgi:hypothetical protein